MPEGTEEVTTTDTEVVDDNEEGIDDGEEGQDDDGHTDEEKEALRKENEDLKNKNKSLYEKLKWGYKKHAQVKEAVKKDFVSKDDVRSILKEIETDRVLEQKLIKQYEDAEELLPEIHKIKEEKNLSIDEAYALVKGKLMSDEQYRNQVNQWRTANHWTFRQAELKTKADNIFSQWPKISKPIKED